MKNLRLMLVAVLLTVAMLPASALADQTSADLDDLFNRLKRSTNALEAAAIEGFIWKVWVHRGVAEVDQNMAHGIVAMAGGDFKGSLSYFDRVVRRDPDFAEGWNKRATVYFLMGNFDASVADIGKTLALEPRHFGALSGMGLIYDSIGNPAAAVKVWEKALEINPHMATIRRRIEEIRTETMGKPI
ncbi:MAG: tetratricopeptide repeat protein [Proteobacteria bacterium]|nr:tetratricopeptide repeat protein [Pseudomonadota bacterium]